MENSNNKISEGLIEALHQSEAKQFNSDLWFGLLAFQLNQIKSKLPKNISGIISFEITDSSKHFYLILDQMQSRACLGQIESEVADCVVQATEAAVLKIISNRDVATSDFKISGNADLFTLYMNFALDSLV
jgi:hypothetical protein